ncbi:MAG TPA: ATP-binding protein, partial [Dongiaceae bacterium]|nr:ATP-binding protein [Dongiaceae bacterium]
VEEVRGLSEQAGAAVALATDDPSALMAVIAELVESLERSHRRLIETNVQLVSLREVASTLVTARDRGETTRLVTRYLATAFGFEHAFLLLLDRERGVLTGCWTERNAGRETHHGVELPLTGDRGVVTRAVWMDRAVLLRDPQRHPPLILPPGHPLEDALAASGSLVCVPLQRSQAVLPIKESHELCGADCMLGDAGVLVPPPGPAAEAWAMEREERQRRCLACELMPILGVIGIARAAGSEPLGHGDVTLLESIAMSVAPVVENARLNQELRASERFRLHVLDGMPSGLVAVDLEGRVLSVNRAATELLGWTEDDARGRPFAEVFGAETAQLVGSTLEQGREVPRQEVAMRGHDGAVLTVRLSTSLLRNDRRQVYGAIATFVDLTPLRRAEEHARAQDRLAALGRFTSSVAHEIRNPLTGIATGVQYLERSLAGADPQRENLRFILSEIRRLDRIVQDLFDITHPRGLQRHTAPLERAVERALLSLEALLTEHGVGVRVSVQPGTPAAPYDPDALQQVFINLIKNAAEASPRGAEVRVNVRRASDPATGPGDALRVAADVRDLGPGIDPQHLKTIFEPFFTTKPGGTGLGLYICHDIVKRHGGALTVRCETGRGCTFTLELPLDADGGLS